MPDTKDGMGEDVKCACGCGATFRLYDDRKRQRAFLPGHYLKLLRSLYIRAKATRKK